MNWMGRSRVLLVGSLLCFPYSTAWSQGFAFQINAGIGEADYRWGTHREHPHQFGEGLDIMLNAELGGTYAFTPDQKVRLLVGGSNGNLSNQQIAGDYQWSLVRRNDRELYVFVGPSLNILSGTYTYHSGFVPPDGQGDYRYVDQRWRPGMKFGTGFQWSKHWAVEIDIHLIRMSTTGFQSIPQATAGYASVMMSYRLPTRCKLKT
jgi:hypothetical protein